MMSSGPRASGSNPVSPHLPSSAIHSIHYTLSACWDYPDSIMVAKPLQENVFIVRLASHLFSCHIPNPNSCCVVQFKESISHQEMSWLLEIILSHPLEFFLFASSEVSGSSTSSNSSFINLIKGHLISESLNIQKEHFIVFSIKGIKLEDSKRGYL